MNYKTSIKRVWEVDEAFVLRQLYGVGATMVTPNSEAIPTRTPES